VLGGARHGARGLLLHWRLGESRELKRLIEAEEPPSPLLAAFAADKADLEEAWEYGLYELLTPTQLAYLQNPMLKAGVRSRYPLTIGDVAKLSGATERQLRCPESNGLLRLPATGSQPRDPGLRAHLHLQTEVRSSSTGQVSPL
jgi:hypothetical protein